MGNKKLNVNRINLYATEEARKDMDWLCKAYGLTRSRLLRVLVMEETARALKAGGNKSRSAVR